MINRFLFLAAALIFTACTTRDEIIRQSPLTLQWELLLPEGYGGSGEVPVKLTITNDSRDTLKAGEWTLYHNSGSLVVGDSATAEVEVRWINGDFNMIAPLTNWESLSPGASRVIQLKHRNLRNLIHVPRGFYLVSPSYPEGIEVNFELVEHEVMQAYEASVAADIFKRNELIQEVNVADLAPVFPTPVAYEWSEGQFELNRDVFILADEEFSAEAQYLQDQLGVFLANGPRVTTQPSDGQRGIYLICEGEMDAEAYRLEVSENAINIHATTRAGAFYAIQSLKSMLPDEAWHGGNDSFVLRGVKIEDKPRFSYRAFMMDVSRNFQTKDQVMKVMDLLAMYKINVFHFHLTDDEAWRLEIPGLEELTLVGARRGHTEDERDWIVPSHGSGPSPASATGSGFFSRADFIEILRYAQSLHIQVIPEIDTPGHARAAVKAMEARFERFNTTGDSSAAWQYRLTDPNDQSQYRSAQAWTDNVMNVALPSVYTFMEKVVDEIMGMYADAEVPLETIHIGGDEVPRGVWTASPLALEFLADHEEYNDVDDLWYYYLDRMDDIFTSRGLYMYGWEEVGMTMGEVDGRRVMVVEPRFADRNFRVDVWNNLGHNVDLAYRMANAGYKVVLTNVSNFYLDLAYNHGFYEMGHNWGGLVDTEKSFRFIPYDYFKSIVDDKTGEQVDQSTFSNRVRLTEDGKKNIVGIQAPLWSEYILGSERMEYMLLPKLLGVAERAWAPEQPWESVSTSSEFDQLYYPDWSAFLYQVGLRELPRLDYLSGGFNYRIPTPGVKVEESRIMANVQIPGLTIRYSTDGSEPTVESKEYTEPVEASEIVIFKVFNKEGRSSLPITLRN